MPIGPPGPGIWPDLAPRARNFPELGPPQARWSESGVPGPGPGESGQIPWFRGVGNDDFNRPKKVFKLGAKSDPQNPKKMTKWGVKKSGKRPKSQEIEITAY